MKHKSEDYKLSAVRFYPPILILSFKHVLSLGVLKHLFSVGSIVFYLTIPFVVTKFNPTNMNELSAPTTHLSRRCSRYYTTVMVDEFNTSKMCNECGNRLHMVKYKITTEGGKQSYREVRGLRWCSSTRCRHFMNRYKNAALNIRRVFMEGRPHCLSRNCSGRAKGKYSLWINQGALRFQDERKIMKSESEEVIICQ